jgi:hypothetical protein
MYSMKTTPQKRIVVDLSPEDHASLKSVAASSGESIRAMVLGAVRSDLQRRRAALTRPAPRSAP